MKLKRGIKRWKIERGEGMAAKKGDRVVYNLKLFLNKGDEVSLNERQAGHLPAAMVRTVDAYRFVDHRITLYRRFPKSQKV